MALTLFHPIPMLSLLDFQAVRAFFLREILAALLNRFVQVFSAVALLAGLAPLFTDRAHSGESAPYFLLQATLYLVPLFALLIGVGSAQNDLEERGFLFSQPAGRSASVIGKFLAVWLLLTVSQALMLLPSALGDSPLGPLAVLWINGAAIAGVFAAIGFAAGISTAERVKAHLGALSIWLLFLAGTDIAALIAANFPAIQNTPSLWVSTLMLNPLDCLRVQMLLAMERVPFDASQTTALARWWLGHLGPWCAVITAAWIFTGLAWSSWRASRWEC